MKREKCAPHYRITSHGERTCENRSEKVQRNSIAFGCVLLLVEVKSGEWNRITRTRSNSASASIGVGGLHT